MDAPRPRPARSEDEDDPPQRQGLSTAQAFLAVLFVAATAAACMHLITRRRGPSPTGVMQREQASRVSYRRVVDLAGRGASRFDPVMANKLDHARLRARRARNRRRSRKWAAAAGSGGCYSLQKESCEPGSQAASANSSCVHPAADHLDAMRATTVCGQRLPRANPCWVEESGNVSCLPAVYLLGEMRCGTTSLYARLLSHPDVEAPLNKEPRYLTLPNYRYHTGSSYAANFAPVARQDERAITLDASPTVFNAPLLAPLWVKKWVPEAKHLVLLRDPIQRTYSHWRAGVDWLKDSSCFVAPAMPANASLARATGFFKPQPLPEIRMMREVFSFDAQARLGLVEVALRECGASLGWGQYGGDEVTLSNETKACILSTSLGEDVAALFRTRQALAGRRTDAERDAYAEGMRRVSACSQYMLVPGAGVWRADCMLIAC